MPRLSENLDHIAVVQGVLELNDASVYLCSDAPMAYIRVNRICEIDRGGVARKDDDLSARGKRVDLLRIQIHLESGHEFGWIAHVALPLDQLTHPRDALIVIGRTATALLIFPMRGDAFFGDLVHFVRPNLNLEVPSAGAHNRSVERLVHVRPRDSDEVLDPAGYRVPFVMDYAQGGITVLHRVGDDPDR